ncbi:MAG TPA: hypothetical protein VFR23_25360 [Jiangellaceae bacterium]|nr:hypothetical protein [Jiangellaceae bacterium]
MPLRPCLDCGTLTAGSRCRACARPIEVEYTRRKRERRPYTNAERERREQAVAEHRSTHGDWCPGWQRPPHETTDLTADHVYAVASGGAEDGELTVLCRPCNSAKGATGG